MIRGIRHKGLQRFWTRGDTSGLRPDWISKVGRLMDALDLARKPQELAMIGVGFHDCAAISKGATP